MTLSPGLRLAVLPKSLQTLLFVLGGSLLLFALLCGAESKQYLSLALTILLEFAVLYGLYCRSRLVRFVWLAVCWYWVISIPMTLFRTTPVTVGVESSLRLTIVLVHRLWLLLIGVFSIYTLTSKPVREFFGVTKRANV